jgi:hypothetical protein
MRKMRKINYDDFVKEKKEKYFEVLALLGRKRLARRKPRDAEERNSLMMLDYERYRRWIRDGVLVEVGPRKYRVTL